MITTRRDGESIFFNELRLGKRGNILETAKKKPGVDTKDEAHNVLNKFDKSPDIPQEHIDEHKERLDKGHEPKEVMKDFFQGLQKAKEKGAKSGLTIKTAKLFRQCGVFKKAEKDVYQDTQTGDFWKISDDGKHIMRMFKENDGQAQFDVVKA